MRGGRQGKNKLSFVLTKISNGVGVREAGGGVWEWNHELRKEEKRNN